MMKFNFQYVLVLLLVFVVPAVIGQLDDNAVTSSTHVIDSSVEQVEWIGESVVLVRTEQGHIFRSDDSGASWTDQTEILEQEAGITGIEAMDIIISPTKNNVVILGGDDVTPERSVWTSSDAGKTWEFISLDLPIVSKSMKFSPLNPLAIAALTKTKECSSQPLTGCKMSLITSMDAGASWTGVGEAASTLDYVSSFDWSRDGTGIWAVALEGAKPEEWDPDAYSSDRHVVFSNDLFKTTLYSVPTGNRVFVPPQPSKFIIVAKYDADKKIALSVSIDEGKTFSDALIGDPIPGSGVVLTEGFFDILDASDDVIFLYVANPGKPYGTVYVSDFLGLSFVTSLDRVSYANIASPTGKADFYKIEGLHGIFIANTLILGEESDEKHVTRITFNKGGEWGPITAPSSPPPPPQCSKPNVQCSLHLHMWHDWTGTSSSQVPPIYSSGSALGLIATSGNVGTALDGKLDPESARLFLSRDAGRTWIDTGSEKTETGSHVYLYEFGDHGGLAVLASVLDAGDTVLYSGNQGLQWNKHTFGKAEEPISLKADYIKVVPSTKGLVFLISGFDETAFDYKLVSIDFSKVFTRNCQPGDYETDSDIGGTCLLGKNTLYQRRKQDSVCLNNVDWEPEITGHVCDCTSIDWECDLGYARDGSNDCKWIGPAAAEPGKIRPKECDDAKKPATVKVTQGYRKVVGDQCVNGVDLSPKDYSCYVGMSPGGVFVLLIVILVAACVGMFALYKTSPRVKIWVDSHVPDRVRAALANSAAKYDRLVSGSGSGGAKKSVKRRVNANANSNYNRGDSNIQANSVTVDINPNMDMRIGLPDIDDAPLDADGQEAGLLSRVLAAQQQQGTTVTRIDDNGNDMYYENGDGGDNDNEDAVAISTEAVLHAPFTVEHEDGDADSFSESEDTRVETNGRGIGLGQSLPNDPSPFSVPGVGIGGVGASALGEFDDFDPHGPL